MDFEYLTTVRGYEIDSYNHLNHVVYLNYMEQARWEIFKKIDLFDNFMENDYKFVVTDLHIHYSKESKIFDELIIKTTLKKDAPYLVFIHKIYNKKSSLKVCQAEIKTLLIDNNKIPYDLPDKIIKHTIKTKEKN